MNSGEFTKHICKHAKRRISLKTKDLPLFGKPIVYMVLSDMGVLYIGMSKNGLSRVFGRNHHLLPRIYPLITEIEIYETETAADARRLERMLINEFKPGLNDKLVYKPKGYATMLVSTLGATIYNIHIDN